MILLKLRRERPWPNLHLSIIELRQHGLSSNAALAYSRINSCTNRRGRTRQKLSPSYHSLIIHLKHLKSMPRSSALVLFDIDGTLLRGAGHHHKQALIHGIRTVTGLSTHLDGISTSGMLDCDLITRMLQAANASDPHAAEITLRIMEECQNAYEANCPADLTPFLCPGVPALLSGLRSRGAVLGLVTGNLSRIARRKMQLAGIGDCFSVGAFAEDASTRTELARIGFKRAIDQALITSFARTSLIGDHPNDIRAAKENGFQSIAVATGLVTTYELEAAEPDILLQTLEELDMERLWPDGELAPQTV